MRKLLQRYRALSLPMRTAIWFTVCNFLQRGTSLITVPIFTRLLTTEQYGLCNVYFSWFEIFVLFASLKLPYEGLNNGLIRYESDKDGYTSSIVGLMAALTVVELAVYLLFRQWIDAVTGFSTVITVFLFIEVAFNPPLYLWINRERFDFRYRMPVVVTLLSTVLTPVIAVVAVLNTSYKAEARIIATSAVQGVFGLILALWLLQKGKVFYKREYWRFALTFNLPLLFYYLSQTLLNQADRIMIQYYVSTGKAGIYSVAYSAASILQLLISAINASYNPWMYRKLKSQTYREVKEVSLLILLLLAGVTLMLMAFAPDLVYILAGETYAEAIWVIPPVAASVFFIFVYMLFANVEMFYDEVRPISLISILCSVVNVVLNALFIPRYGYLAAGWTMLVSYVLLAVLHFLFMKRACRRHQIGETLFHERLLLVISLGVIASAGVMLWLYTLGWVRYVILVIGMAVLFWQRQRLIKVVKQIRG
ncbi:MAG: oligosaccharide flippase family protein [Clostridiales bacterium]|nr:oligosaccharide flippase family protein [Clostridiales bacterium]